MKLFGLKSLYNALYHSKSAAQGVQKGGKKFVLFEKTDKLPISSFPENSWAIPEGAATFKRVRMGKASNPDFNREIVSFYDKENRIIKQWQRGSDIPNQMRVYTYDFGVTKRRKGVKVRNITTSKYLPLDEKFSTWKKVSDETQFVHRDFDIRKEKCIAPKKVQISKTSYDLNSDGIRFSSVTTEYPMNYGIEPKSAKKVLGVDIEMRNGIPYIVGTVQTPNVNFPSKDKFLAYRFLHGAEKQEALVRYFIREKGLEKANIPVGTSKTKVSENAVACFKNMDGEIWFKEPARYMSPADIAAHEAEHAYQYSLDGRLKGHFNTTPYGRKCYNLFGPVPKNQVEEAKAYKEAARKYPVLDPKEDLSKNSEYMYNYLEVKAREAGKKAEIEYEKGRDAILDQFPYTPDHYYYF